MKKTILTVLLALVTVTVLVAAATRLLTPKRVTEAQEGRMVSEYYDSAMNHDVVFIGDCEVYENFDPVVLWEEYGIPSYIRGSPQQLIWQSYYYLEDTLRYETPKVVVFNVLSMKYDEPQSDSYNRLTVEGMSFSLTKFKCAQAGLVKETNENRGVTKENLLTYIFPILRYHSRWSELDESDFKYFFKDPPKITVNGYLMRTDVAGTDFFPKGSVLADYEFSEIDWDYLDRFRLLCEEKGIELILIKAPSTSPYYYDEWDEQIEDYAEKYNLAYYNFLDNVEEMGLDYMTDTYDEGKHLNLSGAEKLTCYFGQILSSVHSLPDRRGEEEYDTEWKEIIAFHDALRSEQEEYLKTHDNLKTFYRDSALEE